MRTLKKQTQPSTHTDLDLVPQAHTIILIDGNYIK